MIVTGLLPHHLVVLKWLNTILRLVALLCVLGMAVPLFAGDHDFSMSLLMSLAVAAYGMTNGLLLMRGIPFLSELPMSDFVGYDARERVGLALIGMHAAHAGVWMCLAADLAMQLQGSTPSRGLGYAALMLALTGAAAAGWIALEGRWVKRAAGRRAWTVDGVPPVN